MSVKLMRHQIFDALRRDILSCKLQPGEEVRESGLAEKYGVSKTPIRDALQKLEQEGLIEIVPRQAHRVAQISVSDAEDILELRAVLEAAALRKVASDASNGELASLDRFRKSDATTLDVFARYNRDFHFMLCRLSGNLRIADTMRQLMDNYERLCVVSLSSRRGEIEAITAAVADHNQIIDALQERNGRAAAQKSARHLRKSHRQIMRGLEGRPVIG